MAKVKDDELLNKEGASRSVVGLKDYNTTTWDETEKGQAAGKAQADALAALKGQNPFAFSQSGWLDEVLGKIQNYGDFSYDMNGDALYQQYKDKYTQQGKLAMADTMGQAAAMTGGYGSSYAQSVGQQAYQGQLNNLNDIVPELAQMAYDRYNAGKQDLYNQYGLLSDQYSREYGQWNDEYGRLMDAYNIANSAYYDGAGLHNSEIANQNSIIGMENDQILANRQFNYNREQDALAQSNWERQFGYQKEQDKQAQDNWDKQFGLSERELAMEEEAWDIEKKEAGYGPKPVATANTKQVTERLDKDKYLSRGGTESEWLSYVEEELAGYLRAGRIDEDDLAYLIQYYGIE